VVESDRRPRYFFATFEALEPDEFAEWEWCDLNDEKYDGVLYGEESDDEEESDDQARAASGGS
jgi:hypothetical protein